jgi:hypothetical protein
MLGKFGIQREKKQHGYDGYVVYVGVGNLSTVKTEEAVKKTVADIKAVFPEIRLVGIARREGETYIGRLF